MGIVEAIRTRHEVADALAGYEEDQQQLRAQVDHLLTVVEKKDDELRFARMKARLLEEIHAYTKEEISTGAFMAYVEAVVAENEANAEAEVGVCD